MRALVSTLCLLAAASAGAAPLVPAPVARALAGAALPGARIEATGYRGPLGCSPERASIDQPVANSGAVAVRIEGHGQGGARCSGLGLADARVYAPVWVASRALAAGEKIEGAASQVEREIRAGHSPLAEIPQGSAAARPLAAGTLLEAPLVEDPSWRPGAAVRVVLRAGNLQVNQQGRIVPCAPGRACALLPSGRRVEGHRAGNELVLETP